MNCCVIGIGSFGNHLCNALREDGIKVIAVDSDIDCINNIQEKVDHAFCLKVIDEESLRNIGIDNFDAVVIAIGNSFEDSIMIAAILKRKFESKYVVCRATTLQQKEILELIGVDYVVLPEQEAGIRLADRLSMKYRNMNRLTEKFSIVYINTNKKWIGKKIKDISIFNSSELTIIGKKIDEDIEKINFDYVLESGDILMMAGNNNYLEKLINF